MMVRYHLIAISLLVCSAAYGMKQTENTLKQSQQVSNNEEYISDLETKNAKNPLSKSNDSILTTRSVKHPRLTVEDLQNEVTQPVVERITEQFKTISENQEKKSEEIVKLFDTVATKKDVESFLTKEEFETKVQEIMQAIVKLQPVKQVESTLLDKTSGKLDDNGQKKQLTKKQKIGMVFVAIPVALLLFFIKAKGKK